MNATSDKRIDLLKILKVSDLQVFETRPTNKEQLTRFIQNLTNSKKQPKGLLLAIKEYDSTFGKNCKFFDALLPFLFNVAKCLPPDDYICSIEPQTSSSQTLRRSTILWILIHTFFMNIKENVGLGAGNLSMESIICSLNQVGVERLLCLMSYFYVIYINPHLLSGSVEYTRFTITNDSNIKWQQRNTTKLSDLHHFIILQNGTMELYNDNIFVDFANEDIHIHKVIPSATQEEILFSLCPELFPAILFCSRMTDRDTYLIKGARRFSTYKGYQHSFQFVSPILSPTDCDVVAIDASVQCDPNERNQFTPVVFARDLIKASIGFMGCCEVLANQKIVTGHWGGGVFGGNKILKFLQQLIAAVLNDCTLTYCTFGDKASFNTMQRILNICSKLQAHTISDLVNLIQTFDPSKSKLLFGDFIVNALINLT
jgi:poly(ADP-ribose) glycohydrolase